jgi:hypothetical protein
MRRFPLRSMSSSSASWVARATVLFCVLIVADARSAPSACRPNRVVVDTSSADTVIVFDDSRGYGQVIQADDTLVTAITFWKAAQPDTFPTPAILFVTNVDSTGRPDVISRVFVSQIVQGPFGDGIHPIPLTFTFDPPMVLPHRGAFFFDLNEQSDQCIGVIRALGDHRNDYAGGGAWKTGTSACDGTYPGGLAAPFDSNLDLIFDITFCDALVPTRRQTWGEIKMLYR